MAYETFDLADGNWYELQPNGTWAAILGLEPQCFRDLDEARSAARRMRADQPDLQFVEIVEYEIENQRRVSMAHTRERI